MSAVCPLCGGDIILGSCTSCGFVPPDEEKIAAPYDYKPYDVNSGEKTALAQSDNGSDVQMDEISDTPDVDGLLMPKLTTPKPKQPPVNYNPPPAPKKNTLQELEEEKKAQRNEEARKTLMDVLVFIGSGVIPYGGYAGSIYFFMRFGNTTNKFYAALSVMALAFTEFLLYKLGLFSPIIFIFSLLD